MIIYVITNKINGKQYVGQTIQPLKRRIDFHKCRRSGCLALKGAFEKYGFENFDIVEYIKAESTDQLNELEIKAIAELNTLAPNGYNLKTGGNRPTYSEEARKKMSESSKGRIPWNKGMGKGPYVKKGRKSILSENHKANIKKGHSYRQTKLICIENGKIYKSIMEASRDLDLNCGNICQVLSGKKSHVKGYTFVKVLK